ncbi:hypothetical protein PASE110613_09240 [Paenibacillus sediminis]|uniref:Uncharacterized protein n=1 Tax=Paenibacillus sediminis TaxID=664909 RepID=A0ABS4H6L6_9BACL|nr:hypothetical protein [Paenibacillus sediminis]MBP1938169.1 hypothetical protein [Paenibacillus sediminis]
MTNAQEEYRRGFEAGYMYGRIDELQGREYDDRTPAGRTGQTDKTGNYPFVEKEAV